MKLCNNVGEMNSQLSRLEVEARQTHRAHKLDAHKEDMIKAIKHLEHLILMAKLMA
jgi:chromosome segregation ATPase